LSSGLADFPPRRYTQRPLPAYRHVPGYSPHPVIDAAGHSYDRKIEGHGRNIEGPPERRLSGDAWQHCADYLYGVDLFNYEFFWEAHERWEPLWHAAGHASPPGRFAKGLIQVAAVFLLKRSDRPVAVPRLLDRAERNLLRAVAEREQATPYAAFGLDLDAWLRGVRGHIADESTRFPLLELAL